MAFIARAVTAALVLVVAALAPAAAGAPRVAARVTSGFITTSDGVRLHYLEAGRGPAILFVPGWTMPAEVWRGQLDTLSDAFRVVALDPRNQGESGRTTDGNFPERRAQDIKEVVDRLHLAPVVLAGWSLGVRESLTYVQRFGSATLRGLVLIDGEIWSEPTDARRQSQASFIHKVETDRRAFTESFVRGMFGVAPPPGLVDRLTRASLRVPASAAVSMLTDLYLANDMRPVVASLDVPLLVLVRQAHADQADIARQVLPTAETTVFDHVGHALFVDDAPRFNARVRQFLSGRVLTKRMP